MSSGPTRKTSGSHRPNPLFRGAGCHHCRGRKVKCDAGKPHCSRCVEQGTTDKCLYDEVKKSKLTLEKENSAALRERIAQLERELAGQSPLRSTPSEDSNPDPNEEGAVPSQFLSKLHIEELKEDEADADVDDAQGHQDEPQSHHAQPSSAVTSPVFEAGAFPSAEQYVPHPQYPPVQPLESSWSIASAATALETPILPTSGFDNYSQPLPYLHPHETPASPGGTPFRQATNYPQGAVFGSHGTYHGGPMASYDAYQGAPNADTSIAVRNRPVPSPPVFGVDLVMNFFQRWKSEQAQIYNAPPSYNQVYSYVEHYPNTSSALVGNWWENDDLPVHHRNYLLELFLPFRKQVGLEIWVPDFLASLHLPPRGRPHPGLMWMIYTFAASFSGDPELQELVPEFMEKARRNLKQSHANGDRLFNFIQGMTLLASLLYMQGRINEGNLEANTACHVAMTCGLHKISSLNWFRPAPPPTRSMLRIRQIDYHLEPPQSAREHGERIAAFWQLVLVDYSAAATTGLPATFRDDGDERSKVETVFPRPIEEYMNGLASLAPYATLRDVFAPRFIPQNPPDIVTTLQVKATALLERAVRLATMWRDGEDLSFTDPDGYRAQYNIVFNAIKEFRVYLPPIRPVESEPQLPCTTNGLAWERIFPHFMTLNAEIQLYYVLGDTDPLAYDRCIDSARVVENLIEQLTDAEITQLGVMFGHCFGAAAHVLQRELKVRRVHQDEAGMARVNKELDVVLKAMAVLGQEHHLVAVQSSRARNNRASESQG